MAVEAVQPAYIAGEDGQNARQIPGAPAEAHDNHGGTDAPHEGQALLAQVVLGLETRIRVADQLKHVAEKVRDDDIYCPTAA